MPALRSRRDVRGCVMGDFATVTMKGRIVAKPKRNARVAHFAVAIQSAAGTSYIECEAWDDRAAWCCELLEQGDPVVIIGELGGTMEEEVAEAMEAKAFTKPLVAFMGGRTAPEGKRMGHAGAIISGGKGTAAEKIAALESSGVKVSRSPADMAKTLLSVWKG